VDVKVSELEGEGVEEITYFRMSTLVNFGADVSTLVAYCDSDSTMSEGVALPSLWAVAPAPVGVEDDEDDRTPVCMILLKREETFIGSTEGTVDVEATGIVIMLV
jgi:hypothetical protein